MSTGVANGSEEEVDLQPQSSPKSKTKKGGKGKTTAKSPGATKPKTPKKKREVVLRDPATVPEIDWARPFYGHVKGDPDKMVAVKDIFSCVIKSARAGAPAYAASELANENSTQIRIKKGGLSGKPVGEKKVSKKRSENPSDAPKEKKIIHCKWCQGNGFAGAESEGHNARGCTKRKESEKKSAASGEAMDVDTPTVIEGEQDNDQNGEDDQENPEDDQDNEDEDEDEGVEQVKPKQSKRTKKDFDTIVTAFTDVSGCPVVASAE